MIAQASSGFWVKSYASKLSWSVCATQQASRDSTEAILWEISWWSSHGDILRREAAAGLVTPDIDGGNRSRQWSIRHAVDTWHTFGVVYWRRLLRKFSCVRNQDLMQQSLRQIEIISPDGLRLVEACLAPPSHRGVSFPLDLESYVKGFVSARHFYLILIGLGLDWPVSRQDSFSLVREYPCLSVYLDDIEVREDCLNAVSISFRSL